MKFYVIWRIIMGDDYYSRTIEVSREIESVWCNKFQAEGRYNLLHNPKAKGMDDRYWLEEIWTEDVLTEEGFRKFQEEYQ